MALNRERITLNPLEEGIPPTPKTTGLGPFAFNQPLELQGDRFGHGIFIQPGGSQWPTATETPQVAQSVDTEGGLVIASTIGLRTPVLKLQVIEPTDPATTNWYPNPQPLPGIGGAGFFGNGFGYGYSCYDLTGFDYAYFQNLTAGNSGNAIANLDVPYVPLQNVPYTWGIWMKGVNGGEQVELQLVEVNGSTPVGSPTNLTVTLTTSWQWFTVTRSNWTTGNGANPTLVQISNTASGIWAAGQAFVEGTVLTEYFDGFFPGCSWLGAENDSVSTRPAAGGPLLAAIIADLENAVKQISLTAHGTIRRVLPNTQTAADPTSTIPTPIGNTTNKRITFDVVNAQLTWDDQAMLNAGVAQGTLTLEVEPYGRGPEMAKVADGFAVLNPNYFNDAGNVGNYNLSSIGSSFGLVAQSAAVGNEMRLLTSGEYPWYAGEVTAEFLPFSTALAGWKGGVIIKRYNANTYIEGYLTYDGTQWQLNLDTVVGGVRSNVLAQPGQPSPGAKYVIAGRIQNQNGVDNVYVEYFQAVWDPNDPASGGGTLGYRLPYTPTYVLGPYALPSTVRLAGTFGTPIPNPLASNQPGTCGLVFNPSRTNDLTSWLTTIPFLARERTLPVLRFSVPIVPGSAPALGRMIVQEDSNDVQYWLRWGQNQIASTVVSGAPYQFTDLYFPAYASPNVGPNLGSAVTGISNSYNTTVWESPTLTSTPTFIESIAGSHIGYYNVYTRAYVTTGASPVTLQLQWGIGDGIAITSNPAVTIPTTPANWYIINLGTIYVPPVPYGLQQWTGNVYASTAGSGQQVAFDYYWLTPLDDGGAVVSGAFTGDAAVFPGQQLEIRSDRANRMHILSGTHQFWSPPSSYTGTYMKIPTQLSTTSVEQISIKGSRTNPLILSDTGVADAIEAQVNITPRYGSVADL